MVGLGAGPSMAMRELAMHAWLCAAQELVGGNGRLGHVSAVELNSQSLQACYHPGSKRLSGVSSSLKIGSRGRDTFQGHVTQP